MILKCSDTNIKIVFLNEQHLNVLNAHNLKLSDLEYLPKFPAVSEGDCLDWLRFQRGVELQYCGKSITSYEDSGNYKFIGVNRESSLYKAKYNELLESKPKVKLGLHFSYQYSGGVLYILNSSNSVPRDNFSRLDGTLETVIYQSILNVKSFFRLFFKENPEVNKAPYERDGLDLSFVIGKCLM